MPVAGGLVDVFGVAVFLTDTDNETVTEMLMSSII